MAVKFKVVQKVNPIKKEDPAKFYAQAEVSGDVTLDTLARRVAKASMTTIPPHVHPRPNPNDRETFRRALKNP